MTHTPKIGDKFKAPYDRCDIVAGKVYTVTGVRGDYVLFLDDEPAERSWGAEQIKEWVTDEAPTADYVPTAEHSQDIATIYARLQSEAADRSWCSEFNTMLESLNVALHVPLKAAEPEWIAGDVVKGNASGELYHLDADGVWRYFRNGKPLNAVVVRADSAALYTPVIRGGKLVSNG